MTGPGGLTDAIENQRRGECRLKAKLKRLDNWDCNGNQFEAKKCFKSGKEGE
jgi:hypothetical protein